MKAICHECGLIYVGETLPGSCPSCGKSDWIHDQWAAMHGTGCAGEAPEDLLTDIRTANREACLDVGRYMAMARAAAREGYPEVAAMCRATALEKADQAGRWSECLGEDVAASTEENLERRYREAYDENYLAASIAKRAIRLNLKGIHDYAHEIASETATQGEALLGLKEHYSKK